MREKTLNNIPRMNGRSMIWLPFLALLSAFPVFSTDMYLPGLPGMAGEFGVSTGLTNLTLSLFFITFSTSMLLWGPYSDRNGRKRTLHIGTCIYVASSIACIFSRNIYMLLGFRVTQAIGGAAAGAVALAITKDIYPSREREKIIAALAMIIAVSPICAPLAGAAIINAGSWRTVFGFLAALGVVALAGSLLIRETLPESERSSAQLIVNIKNVLANSDFRNLLILFSLVAIPMLAFVGLSPFIYVNIFGLSESKYTMFFSCNALCMMIGPMLYLKLAGRINKYVIITGAFAAICITGGMIAAFGHIGPVVFTLLLVPASLSVTVVRPPSANLMLEQVKKESGTASALIGCSVGLLGSIGITVVSLDWADRIVVLGSLYAAIGFLSLIYWIMIKKNYDMSVATAD